MSKGACKVVRDNYQELASLDWGFCLEQTIRKMVLEPAITEDIGRIYDSDDPKDKRLTVKLQDAQCANQMSEEQQEWMRKFLLRIGDD